MRGKNQYPNLELLEYIAKECLLKDEDFVNNMKIGDNSWKMLSFEVIVFHQMWGSTSTGFDVDLNGEPVFGGCAMTGEYTTVMHELSQDVYAVFFGQRICYLVRNPSEMFFQDLEKRNLRSLSEAKKLY